MRGGRAHSPLAECLVGSQAFPGDLIPRVGLAQPEEGGVGGARGQADGIEGRPGQRRVRGVSVNVWWVQARLLGV